MATNSFYRTPYLTTASFAAGVLLFFLPFLEIKCNGNTLGELSGTAMVTGAEPKFGGELENMTKAFNPNGEGLNKTTDKTKQEGKVYMAAIIALGLGILGVVLSLIKKGIYNKGEMLIGILGTVALLVLMFQVKGDVDSQLKDKNPGTDSFSAMMKVSVDFTFWFYLCVLSYLSAAFFSYKQKGLVFGQEVPPANAPQINLQNPGDQSDFPAAPSGEKNLG